MVIDGDGAFAAALVPIFVLFSSKANLSLNQLSIR